MGCRLNLLILNISKNNIFFLNTECTHTHAHTRARAHTHKHAHTHRKHASATIWYSVGCTVEWNTSCSVCITEEIIFASITWRLQDFKHRPTVYRETAQRWRWAFFFFFAAHWMPPTQGSAVQRRNCRVSVRHNSISDWRDSLFYLFQVERNVPD